MNRRVKMREKVESGRLVRGRLVGNSKCEGCKLIRKTGRDNMNVN